MANPLTGDFNAVLQISASTVNRLLASMHQQPAGAKEPHLPHGAVLRIGDDRAIDGVRGTARVQVGVPRIAWKHGATDRFLLEVGIRARYRPDSGTTPLPQFIHGTVRAEYRMERIDPNCVGWKKLASDYIWIRVIKDTVTFTGTATDEFNTWEIAPAVDEAAVNARIVRQIATLLATRFEARPERISGSFKPGRMRGLWPADADAAVALPVPVGNEEPAGAVASIENVLLEGSDFAVGVRVEHILGIVEPAVAQLRTLSRTLGPYTASVTSANVVYEARGSDAQFVISIAGRAVTSTALPDFNIAARQTIGITFDPASESLVLSAPAPWVKVTSSKNLLSSQAATNYIAQQVQKLVHDKAKAAISGVAPSFASSREQLASQLRTLDAQADAWFDNAHFGPHGVVLRGSIAVAPRRRPELTLEKTPDGDGFSAHLSWLPGGRIDAFTWSWSWYGSGAPGVATHDDRFVLRRPKTAKSHWGGIVASAPQTTPLPGLDGGGVLCLRLKGSVVDPVTGAWVPIDTRKRCLHFGFPIRVTPHEGIGSLFWRTWPEEPELSRDAPFPELGLLEVGSPVASPAPAANTLVLYVGSHWNRESMLILREALHGSRRRDAGLAVVVLFGDGVLARGGRGLLAEVEEMAPALGTPVVANEDVLGTWSAALALPHEGADVAWRLVSPGGGVTWMHDGRLRSDALRSALDTFLVPSPPAAPEPLAGRIMPDDVLLATAFHPGLTELMQPEERPCPFPPVATGFDASIITFARRSASSSAAHLRDLHARYGDTTREGTHVVVVLGGADQRDVEALKNELGVDFTVLPDPQGTMSRRFGIRFWPTTLTVDGSGVVTDIEYGRRHRASRDPDRDATAS
jgi:hypothetical protein